MDKGRIQDVRGWVPRFAAYLKREPSWGCLHVVLDDLNLEDSWVEWCREYAQSEGDAEAEELAAALLDMSRTQRAKLDRLCRAHNA